MENVVRVLVVDDSAYVRKVVTQMLTRSPFIEVVGTARDGEDALEKVQQLRPDVVTLDLIMPGMDGVAFLREQMARRPLPVLVVSISSENSDQAMRALEAGAVDLVRKPTALATEKVLEIADELIQKVKAAAQSRVQPLAPVATLPAATAGRGHAAVDVVVLGISTGGPQALRYLIPLLPEDLPVPLAVVLHMPLGYTELYARSLAEVSRLPVIEAAEGEPLRPGVVMLAQAGRHLRFLRGADGTVAAHLSLSPVDTPHRPAVDVLFRSAADVFGDRVLAVVMTGMGTDGMAGAAWVKAQGGRVLTEAEESCVVYGMPRAVVEAGISDRSVPLHKMAEAILESL